MVDSAPSLASSQYSQLSGCLNTDAACLRAASVVFKAAAVEEKRLFAEKQKIREAQAADYAARRENADDMRLAAESSAGSAY